MTRVKHAEVLIAYLSRLKKADMDLIAKKMDEWTFASLNLGNRSQWQAQEAFSEAVTKAVNNMISLDIEIVESKLKEAVNG